MPAAAPELQRWPKEGQVMPLLTPAGARYYRVYKANDERVTLLALTREENLALLAKMQADLLGQRRQMRLHRRVGRVIGAVFGRKPS